MKAELLRAILFISSFIPLLTFSFFLSTLNHGISKDICVYGTGDAMIQHKRRLGIVFNISRGNLGSGKKMSARNFDIWSRRSKVGCCRNMWLSSWFSVSCLFVLFVMNIFQIYSMNWPCYAIEQVQQQVLSRINDEVQERRWERINEL